jgi:8-oxo-dGTP pyrophosphatase MutT (NUDIX family)
VKLDVETFRARVQGALETRSRKVAEADDRVPAAVMILVVYHGDVPHLVFTKKTETVPHHKGQFSFPGGLVETFDGSRVDDVPTATTRFVITPVVGLCPTPPALRPDGREIERVLEVPLEHLLDRACFREELWERGGEQHLVAFFTYGEDVIWGATARILKEFLAVVFPG